MIHHDTRTITTAKYTNHFFLSICLLLCLPFIAYATTLQSDNTTPLSYKVFINKFCQGELNKINIDVKEGVTVTGSDSQGNLFSTKVPKGKRIKSLLLLERSCKLLKNIPHKKRRLKPSRSSIDFETLIYVIIAWVVMSAFSAAGTSIVVHYYNKPYLLTICGVINGFLLGALIGFIFRLVFGSSVGITLFMPTIIIAACIGSIIGFLRPRVTNIYAELFDYFIP